MGDIVFHESSDYRALSESASDHLIALIHRKPDALICLATGATPLLTYQLFVEGEEPKSGRQSGHFRRAR